MPECCYLLHAQYRAHLISSQPEQQTLPEGGWLKRQPQVTYGSIGVARTLKSFPSNARAGSRGGETWMGENRASKLITLPYLPAIPSPICSIRRNQPIKRCLPHPRRISRPQHQKTKAGLRQRLGKFRGNLGLMAQHPQTKQQPSPHSCQRKAPA